MNNENKRDELIKYEFSEKEKRCQKGKCRKLAYKITENGKIYVNIDKANFCRKDELYGKACW